MSSIDTRALYVARWRLLAVLMQYQGKRLQERGASKAPFTRARSRWFDQADEFYRKAANYDWNAARWEKKYLGIADGH